MTEKENSSMGWNPSYMTVCISPFGKIVRSGDKEIMAKFAKDNNYILAEIKIISFDGGGKKNEI